MQKKTKTKTANTLAYVRGIKVTDGNRNTECKK